MTFTNAAVIMTATLGNGGTTPPPPPPGVVLITAPGICGSAAGSTITFNMGTTYAFLLPKTTTGAGQVAISSEGGVGTNAQLEVSFSKVAGDWTTAKNTAQVSTSGFFGVTTYPYYTQQGGYASLAWQGTAGSSALVPPAEQWYVNFRMSNATGYLTVQLSSPGCN